MEAKFFWVPSTINGAPFLTFPHTLAENDSRSGSR